ncbi:hypothetical protein OG986_11515 [Streptomyces cellulosae]|uniref:hypothetical protein n=1 Tax=Streptomyces sp. Akac8 TaxID=2563106 RepID=UPI00109E6CBD|nr:hypothetical protein E7X38_32105 [Streptomyces sp. Akac8]WSB84555.1 hypothetical protein OHA60_12670 [Streptomyces cellulosae]WSB91239.1 hypothetical protein OG805_11905 [Streptomyces cellulosae]WTC18611.1 hypothetical protein OH709_23460 [Streptomyces cellulosae]
MRALPARRIAFGALCAALLTTTTGPTALAADAHPGQDPAVSLAARLPQTDTARADLTPVTDLARAILSAPDGRLPLTEAQRLATAAREAVERAGVDDPAAAATNTPALLAPLLPGAPASASNVLSPTAEEDDGTGALGAVREALDKLLDLLLPKPDQAAADSTATTTDEASSTSETSVSGTTESTEATEGTTATDETAVADAADAAAEAAAEEALTSTDELLARVEELLDALTGTDPQTATTLPAPAEPAESATSPGLLPALTSLLLPNS